MADEDGGLAGDPVGDQVEGAAEYPPRKVVHLGAGPVTVENVGVEAETGPGVDHLPARRQFQQRSDGGVLGGVAHAVELVFHHGVNGAAHLDRDGRPLHHVEAGVAQAGTSGAKNWRKRPAGRWSTCSWGKGRVAIFVP